MGSKPTGSSSVVSVVCCQVKVSETSLSLVERSPAEIVGSKPTGSSSVVSVVCCQVEVSATSLSLVQRSPTNCCASLYVI